MNALIASPLFDKFTHCLCPPGNGVFTVNTAKERKEQLHQHIYGTTEGVNELWSQSLHQLPSSSRAVLLGIASDCGGGILRGANWGPLFLRSTLLEQFPHLNMYDLGDVRVIPHLLHDKYLNDSTIKNCQKALYGDHAGNFPVAPLTITEDVLTDFYQAFPDKGIFGIGGDHSVSYPLVKTYLQAKAKQGKRAAIIHFDAHTDLLKERLGIDLCFGSWCTHILDDLPTPSSLIQVGIRSSGKPKAHWENTFGVQQHWANEVKSEGAEAIVEKILKKLLHNNIDELYVSFDIDAIDEKYASATGTPEPDGLHPDDAMYILHKLGKHYKITGADMMEIAPFTQSVQQNQHGQETTLNVAAKISAYLIDEISKA